jgi:TonB family protein
LRPSPLTTHSQPPAGSQATAPPSSRFVNPADQAHRNRVADQYIWQVLRKFSQYFPDLRVKNEEGTVVLRLVIAHDGRLLESGIAKSSGLTVLDKAMLDTARAAAPYGPMPPELGERMTFNVPIQSRYR